MLAIKLYQMPLATVHLIALRPSTTIADFVKALATNASLKVLVISKVIRWIITPEKIDVSALLHPRKPWDLVVITLGGGDQANDNAAGTTSSSSSSSLLLPGGPLHEQYIECHWSATAGIPSRLTNNFASENKALLHPSGVPALTDALENPRLGRSAQTLELSPSLRDWINEFAQTGGVAGGGAVSMLNLLSFLPDSHASYLVYGRAFAESIGSRHGGRAKLVGTVIANGTGHRHQAGWDEFALAHYPSILHFADMLASADYQAVNLQHRVPSLRDTCILCTSEIAVEEELAKGGSGVESRKDAKL
ncbi:hypothetical protein DV735_g5483, partial [Chaetothyriales sp. CBS 134920]